MIILLERDHSLVAAVDVHIFNFQIRALKGLFFHIRKIGFGNFPVFGRSSKINNQQSAGRQLGKNPVVEVFISLIFDNNGNIFTVSINQLFAVAGDVNNFGLGRTRTPPIVTLVTALLNAVLDPFLIFGIRPFPALGVSGAALATVIAKAAVFIYLSAGSTGHQRKHIKRFPTPPGPPF